MSKSIHLPGLNGLRAIAALSVLWGHIYLPSMGNWGMAGREFTLPVVSDGVTLFFVISGFLITYLLLNEERKSRTVNIPKFYMRRILRIWPIYYVYMVLALTLTGLWGDGHVWWYVFFTANIPFIFSLGIWPIAHYWSIGVEEQFYLFWPWLVRLTKGKMRRLMTLALGVCLGWLACKMASYLVWGTTAVYRFFAVTRFDCMMLGAMGAILYYKRNPLFMKTFGNRWVGTVSLVALMFSLPWAEYIPAPIRPQVLAVLSLATIMGQVSGRPVISLENRLCDSVGKISYGIYVIHPLMIYFASQAWRQWAPEMNTLWSNVLIYCGMTIAVYVVAWLSYRYLESPFLRLKNRFAIVQSSSTMKG